MKKLIIILLVIVVTAPVLALPVFAWWHDFAMGVVYGQSYQGPLYWRERR